MAFLTIHKHGIEQGTRTNSDHDRGHKSFMGRFLTRKIEINPRDSDAVRHGYQSIIKPVAFNESSTMSDLEAILGPTSDPRLNRFK